MTPASVGVTRGILRNAGALLLVGLFAKGAGLVIAVLVARFLGANAMGLFAVLFSISVLIEAFISLGMSDSLVRDVAARPAEAPGMFVAALKLVGLISILPTTGLLVAAWLLADPPAARECLLILAFGTPVSGAFVIAQAVLQGTERVLLLTWATFVARVLSLAFLAWLFFHGAGIAAAFLSRILFHLLSLAVFAHVILRQRELAAVAHSPRRLFGSAMPFAVNTALRELGTRLPALVLPASIGLAQSGIFDTANRLRSTLGMTMSASITGLMPAFARSRGEPGDRAGLLIGYSAKYMCLGMSLVATGIALFAAWIVNLLYGPAFEPAALPLQLLAWAQVLIAMDAVLQQALLARRQVTPAIRHSALGAALQCGFLVLLSRFFGLQGAAMAVLLASASMLAFDLRHVVGCVARIETWHLIWAPLLAASSVALFMLVTSHLSFPLRALVAVGSWAAAVAVFRVLPREELRFMRHLVNPSRDGEAGGP